MSQAELSAWEVSHDSVASHDHCLEGAGHGNYLVLGDAGEEVSKDCFQHKCCQREIL